MVTNSSSSSSSSPAAAAAAAAFKTQRVVFVEPSKMVEGRESWNNYCEFFLSSLGLAVGLGNVWRFPYVCYTNGGGSFLVPYILMLFAIAMPALFLEQSIGQYGRVGANKVFGRMVPVMKGIGYGMITVRFFVNVYYVIICAWTFFYLFAGFTSDLPWAYCDREWNTWHCFTQQLDQQCKNISQDLLYFNQSCVSYQQYCVANGFQSYSQSNQSCTVAGQEGGEPLPTMISRLAISPAEDYFNSYVLGYTVDQSGKKRSWSDFGQIRWQLVLCLLLSWMLIALSLFKGLKAYGKVAYIITLAPYFVLTALLIYSAQLPGASEGLAYLFKPDWSKLADVNIWAAAASQILFSLSVGFGSQLVLSSYNNFHNNCHRDTILVSICNSLTSIYAGIVVFCILGFMAKQANSTIDEVVKGGISLAFVSYPAAVLQMDVSPLWSFLFFFMLINLAMSSICAGVQTFLAFIIDENPRLGKYRAQLVFVICSMFFLCGLPMCMEGGILLFTVFDKRCTSSLLFICFMEVIHVGYIYGIKAFLRNLEQMNIVLWKAVRWYWTALWMVVMPLILAFITVFAWIKHETMSYSGYVFPDAAEALGWSMELLPLVVMLTFSVSKTVMQLRRQKDGQLWQSLLAPSAKWVPQE